jgi:hypothetical protein
MAPPSSVKGSDRSPSDALPVGFRYTYESSFRGWPVAPLHREHPVRSTFLAPRPGGYHIGVDIAVNDWDPEPGAPPGRSHRVYAVDSGHARVGHSPTPHPGSCRHRRIGVGHFVYWHVDPTVDDGTYVRAGQTIGWTCRGRWHVHLSEWAVLGGRRIWVNPLHPGGKLLPYSDTSVPSMRSLRFFTPASRAWSWLGRADSASPLRVDALRGRVELRVRVEDRRSFTGWLARNGTCTITHNPPYRLAVRVADAFGRVVLSRVAFQSDRLPTAPVTVRYAPPTVRDPALWQCLASKNRVPVGALSYRPFSRQRLKYWDTRTVPDGVYFVTVIAWDITGNHSNRVVRVEVANREPE